MHAHQTDSLYYWPKIKETMQVVMLLILRPSWAHGTMAVLQYGISCHLIISCPLDIS